MVTDTKTAVENKLEHVVKAFKWEDEFLGVQKRSFLRSYRTMQAQLRQGDRLEMEIVKEHHECTHTDINYPEFRIMLYRKDGTNQCVYRCDSGENSSSVAELLLYDD